MALPDLSTILSMIPLLPLTTMILTLAAISIVISLTTVIVYGMESVLEGVFEALVSPFVLIYRLVNREEVELGLVALAIAGLSMCFMIGYAVSKSTAYLPLVDALAITVAFVGIAAWLWCQANL